MSDTRKGTLKFFDRRNQFGFVIPDKPVGKELDGVGKEGDLYIAPGSFSDDMTLGEFRTMTVHGAPEDQRRVTFILDEDEDGDGNGRSRVSDIRPA